VYVLAMSRRTAPAKLLLKVARAIVKGLENYSFNIRLNGEEDTIRRLAGAPLTTFFDVGANRGNWAGAVRRYFPDATIHCFELAPPTHALLAQRFAGDAKVRVNPVGLSDRDGEIEFHYGESDDGHTSILPEQYAKGVYKPMKGRLTTGDAYCEKEGVRGIDFLKLDVEGVEHLTLAGFERMLAQGAVKVVQFEYSRYSVMTNFLLKDFYALLDRHGFVTGKIFPRFVLFKPYSIEDEDFLGPNYLAVRKDQAALIERLS
jgi:FkbM family methyltransferase